MEQTNLVVTPDGQTWDEVTRDVSYIGAQIHRWGWTTTNITGETYHVSDSTHPWLCRGFNYGHNYSNKNFVYAYDRHICLRDGKYQIYTKSYGESGWGNWKTAVNGTVVDRWFHNSGGNHVNSGFAEVHLKRGDYVQVQGGHLTDASNWSNFHIIRLED